MLRNRHSPRLLSKADAAAYLGISAAVFDQICDIRPVELADGRERLRRFDVTDLDRWIDQRKGVGPESGRPIDHFLERLGHDRNTR